MYLTGDALACTCSYCHRLDTIAVLEGLRAPLLGTATREDRNSRPKDSPGGDVGGVAGDGITLRTNSLSRISERQLSAQLSGTNLANRMAHVSRDLHGLLQDASVNLISPDVRARWRWAQGLGAYQSHRVDSCSPAQCGWYLRRLLRRSLTLWRCWGRAGTARCRWQRGAAHLLL